MIRTAVFLAFVCGVLSACSGSIETRIETQMMSPLPSGQHYQFTRKPEQASAIYDQARALVSEGLDAKGLNQSENGSLLVQVTVAERPASIGITTGEKDTRRDVAIPKTRKFLQSCDDVEHRFSVTLLDLSNGAIVYRGKAGEFHCKGQLADSLPSLIREALSDLGSGPMSEPRKSAKKRGGIE